MGRAEVSYYDGEARRWAMVMMVRGIAKGRKEYGVDLLHVSRDVHIPFRERERERG